MSEFMGSEVVDVHQHRVGRVRDVTVRVEEPYPVVTGLVLSRRAEVVVPWTEVRTIAGREVALRGDEASVPRLSPEPSEVWLSRDILDKQVIDTDGRRVVRVNDLQLSESGGAMLLVGADIGIRGILRRLGLEALGKAVMRVLGKDLPMVLLSWNVVDPFQGRGAEALRLRISGARIAKLHPADIADIVEELGARERTAVFESLTQEVAADTLEEMELEDQVAVVEQMGPEKASDILEEMPPDEVADILSDLGEARAREILALMEDTEKAGEVRELLAYRQNTSGGLMTTEYVAVSDRLTAQDCIRELRRMEPDAESIYYVYVVDQEEHLRGVLSLRDLIVARPRTPIRDIMIQEPVAVGPDASLEEVAAVLSKYNLLAVPVVDAERRLLGIVTHDDALERILPESVRRRLPRLL
ncbi:MAG: magnesium transporter MgtE N-terminal domain-containing protein [Candidatus Dormibacterales bacterium]